MKEVSSLMKNEVGDVQLLKYDILYSSKVFSRLLLMYELYIPELKGDYIIVIKATVRLDKRRVLTMINSDELLKTGNLINLELIEHVKYVTQADILDAYRAYESVSGEE